MVFSFIRSVCRDEGAVTATAADDEPKKDDPKVDPKTAAAKAAQLAKQWRPSSGTLMLDSFTFFDGRPSTLGKQPPPATPSTQPADTKKAQENTIRAPRTEFFVFFIWIEA